MADEIVTLLKYTPTKAFKKCAFCDTENSCENVKCFMCGTDLSIEETPIRKKEPPKDTTHVDGGRIYHHDGSDVGIEEYPKDKTPIIWTVTVIAIAAVVFALLYYFNMYVPKQVFTSSNQEALLYNNTLIYTVSNSNEKIYKILDATEIRFYDENNSILNCTIDEIEDDYNGNEYTRQYIVSCSASKIRLIYNDITYPCDVKLFDKNTDIGIKSGYYNIFADTKNKLSYDVKDVSLNETNTKWKIESADDTNNTFYISKFNDTNNVLQMDKSDNNHLFVDKKSSTLLQKWRLIKVNNIHYIVSAYNSDLFLTHDGQGNIGIGTFELLDENYEWTLEKIEGYERYVEYEWKQSYPNNAGWASMIFKEEQKNCMKLSFNFQYAHTENGYGYPFGRTAKVFLKIDGKWKEFKTFTTPNNLEESQSVEINFEELTNISEIYIMKDEYEQYHYSYRMNSVTVKVI